MLVTENKWDLKERYCEHGSAGWDGVDWVDLAQDRDKYKLVCWWLSW